METESPADGVSRDSEHYHDDGDLVIRAESTLFNVHRFIFRDSAIFRSMFTLPVGPGAAAEGSCDGAPLVLEGYSADEFRMVLKWMYSRPLALNVNTLPSDVIAEVIPLAAFAHKYELDAWREWSLSVIDYRLKPARKKDSGKLPLSRLHTLFERMDDSPRRSRIMNMWIESLQEKTSVPSCVEAISAAERVGDRESLVRLYMIFIRQSCVEPQTMLINPKPLRIDQVGLDPIHVQRILMGYMSLALGWSAWRAKPPNDLPFPEGKKWALTESVARDLWLSAVEKAEKAYPAVIEVPQRLATIADDFGRSYIVTMNPFATAQNSSLTQYPNDLHSFFEAFKLLHHFFPE
ncbi:unnamed protein product [Mycena citricolor]|uniref:BTB domain-containing protein n=1 Tax=Mycena citricolor TaxID=2018698 RepID=A0AAD2HX24_9AGAR|nr:unnamed protein product [Mycena citricolor]